MILHQALLLLRDRIEHPEHWTKNTFARDIEGREVPQFSTRAHCMCLASHISRVAPSPGLRVDVRYAIQEAIEAITGAPKFIVNFNDDPKTTHEDIKKVVNYALKVSA